MRVFSPNIWGTPYMMACILIKLCPTLRHYSMLPQISFYSQSFNNNTIPFCPFTLWTSGPVAQPGHPGGVRLPCAHVTRYLVASNTNPQG